MLKLADFLRPLKPATKFEETLLGQFWEQDGQIHYRFKPIRGADAETFRRFLGGYAIDKKACYSGESRLAKADPKTFQVLNYTYAKDAHNVWGMGIRIPTADPKTFQVCDDGARQQDDSDRPYWYGYAKDKSGVYYYNFDGKPILLKKADPATFESVGKDKLFGVDQNFAFFGAATIPKADRQSWEPIAGVYSRDAERVFYRNQVLTEANPAKFKVLKSGEAKHRGGCDNAHCYYAEMPISREKFDKLATGKLDWTVLAGELNRRRADGRL